jgi:hypothetical protein
MVPMPWLCVSAAWLQLLGLVGCGRTSPGNPQRILSKLAYGIVLTSLLCVCCCAAAAGPGGVWPQTAAAAVDGPGDVPRRR